jgi:hypothetical protein
MTIPKKLGLLAQLAIALIIVLTVTGVVWPPQRLNALGSISSGGRTRR